MRLLSNYFFSEFIKICRIKQLRYVFIFVIFSTVLWAFFFGVGSKIDGGATHQVEHNTLYIFFIVFNYFILPFSLFIPFFCLNIEHENHVITSTYFVYLDEVTFILTKLIWVILLYEITIGIALYGGIFVLTYALGRNLGEGFNAASFKETAFSYMIFYGVLYTPIVILTFLFSLKIKKFSLILGFIVCLHLFSIQDTFKEINPFHALFFVSSIHERILSNNSLYTTYDINKLYFSVFMTLLFQIIASVFVFKQLKRKTDE